MGFFSMFVRMTLLEAWRGQLFKLASAICLLVFLSSYFLGALALVEASETRVTFSAFLVRLGLTFALISFVIFGLAREFSDRQIQFALASPISRTGWLIGRYMGLLVLCLMLAISATLVLWPYVLQPVGLIWWGLSFFVELALLAAFSIFVGLAFTQSILGLSVALAFYVLARSFESFLLMVKGPYGAPGSTMEWIFDTLVMLFPRLYDLSSTGWLVGAPIEPIAVLGLLAETGVYIALIILAACADLQRKVF